MRKYGVHTYVHYRYIVVWLGANKKYILHKALHCMPVLLFSICVPSFSICVAQKPNMVQIPGTVLYSTYQKKGGARKGGTVMYRMLDEMML